VDKASVSRSRHTSVWSQHKTAHYSVHKNAGKALLLGPRAQSLNHIRQKNAETFRNKWSRNRKFIWITAKLHFMTTLQYT
jgi:hypothetical protein